MERGGERTIGASNSKRSSSVFSRAHMLDLAPTIGNIWARGRPHNIFVSAVYRRKRIEFGADGRSRSRGGRR